MSFFRRLSLRRRSNRKRRHSHPGIQKATSTETGASRPASFAHPNARLDPGPDLGPDCETGVDNDAKPKAPAPETIDVYEDRIDELGQLMTEQGRCLDELTVRSRRLSTENSMLRDTVMRERLSKPAPAPAPSSPKRSPLRNIVNTSHESIEIMNLKEENALLSQQAVLLANELADANKLIDERDASITSLGKELSSCTEKARSLMMEKKTWKSDMNRNAKQIENLEDKAAKASSLQSETSLKAEQYLSERKELEIEVIDLGSQMSHLVSKAEDFQLLFASKQGEVEKLTNQLDELERTTLAAKHEAKTNAEAKLTLKDNLRCTQLKNEQLDLKLKDAKDELSDNKIGMQKLQTLNESLQSEINVMTQKHISQIAGWAKGHSKAIDAMKDNNLEQSRLVENLRRSNATLESDGAQIKRNLQSSQQRCSALEKLLTNKEKEHMKSIDDMLHRLTNAETALEASRLVEKGLKSDIVTQIGKISTLQLEMKNKDDRHVSTIGILQAELLSAREQNQSFSFRIANLEEEMEKTNLSCSAEIKRMEEATKHRIKEVGIECETLRMANQSSKLKLQDNDELLCKNIVLHESAFGELSREKEELTIKMERVVSEEREVGKRLMAKVQELSTNVQALTAEKLQQNHLLCKKSEQIHTLEKIIASGELKLSRFGKQLARSMEDQEQRIRNEVELKRQLDRLKRGH
ncbi:hypothetical protein ACHAWF_003774 [Thalassiosira exigua]